MHADTRLAPGALELVEHTLAADPGIAGGSFTLRFDGPGAVLRLFEMLGDLYHPVSRLLHRRPRRQGLVRRGAFDALHGFRTVPFMEDYDLGRRLRRLGDLQQRRPVVTSAREFNAQGPLMLGVKLCLCLAGYRMGVPPRRLRRFYYDRGARDRLRSAAGAGHVMPAAKGVA